MPAPAPKPNHNLNLSDEKGSFWLLISFKEKNVFNGDQTNFPPRPKLSDLSIDVRTFFSPLDYKCMLSTHTHTQTLCHYYFGGGGNE